MAQDDTTKLAEGSTAKQAVMDIIPSKKDEAGDNTSHSEASRPGTDQSEDEKALADLLEKNKAQSPSKDSDREQAKPTEIATTAGSGESKTSVNTPTSPSSNATMADVKPAPPMDHHEAKAHTLNKKAAEKSTNQAVQTATKPKAPGTSLAIIAAVIIVLGLGLLMVYAYLRSNNISFF